MQALEVQGLSKTYSGFALKEVSFTLPQGMIMGFVGENGAGKTTTMKAMLNIIRRDSGTVKIFGQDLEQNERELKEQIGVVFEDSSFYEGMRPLGISRVMGGIFRGWDPSYFEELLERFQLPNQPLKSYSRGMRMKLSLAAALGHRPKLLLLDEATSGLDPVVREEVLDLLRDFVADDNRAVLLSSHITSDLDKAADYVTFLHKGRVVFSNSCEEIRECYGVLKCPAGELEKLDPSSLLRVRKGQFGCQALLRNAADFRRTHPGMMVERTDLEEIMLFYAKGEAL